MSLKAECFVMVDNKSIDFDYVKQYHRFPLWGSHFLAKPQNKAIQLLQGDSGAGVEDAGRHKLGYSS